LEAMQEQQVTVGGQRHILPNPFFVLATQNPIEQEGTYPLPEAQLDRFLFMVLVDYPSEDEELEIVKRTTADISTQLTSALSAEDIIELSRIVRRVPVADHLARYAIQFARRTRVGYGDVPDMVRDYVSWGAGPRRAPRPLLRQRRRHSRRRACRAPPPNRHQLQRRSRRPQARRHRGPPRQNNPRRRRRRVRT
jgi:MoxR-like ATPase